MTESPRCVQCGHAPGPGRYCTNCGRPVDGEWRTDTAERPSVPPTVVAGGAPPPAFGPPPGARYPLYADQAGPEGGQAPPTVVTPSHPPPSHPPPSHPPPHPPYGAPTSHRRRRGALPWVIGVAAVALLAVVGALLLLGVGGDDDGDGDTARDPGSSASDEAGSSSPPSSSPPSSEPTSAPPSSAPAGPPEDLTGTASISAPVTAPPGTDVDGDPVTYNADNMLDGVPATAWRMPGDGAGTEIRIDFGRPVVLDRVGLLNGYAKRDPGYDGYAANRRITRVVWQFDDGSEQAQLLDEVRRVQTLDVGPVTTTTVTLRIVTVTAPGRGARGRDYTAISDVALAGSPVS